MFSGGLQGERRPGVGRQRMCGHRRRGIVTLLAGAVLMAWWLGATPSGSPPAGAQPGSPPARPRALYQAGFDLFKRGDYEQAAIYYAEADKGRDELSPREQIELRKAVERNNVALQARRDGAVKIRMAEEAARQGRTLEANNLLKLADTQYLSPADRQALQRVQERMKSSAMAQGPELPSPTPIKGDYKSLLAAGRTALQHGDFEMAEALANQADQVAPKWWLNPPWHDNTNKLRRDIQNTRRSFAAQPGDKKEGLSPFKGLRNMFKPAPSPKEVRNEERIRQVGNDGPTLPPPPPMLLPKDKGFPQEAGPTRPPFGSRADGSRADRGGVTPAEAKGPPTLPEPKGLQTTARPPSGPQRELPADPKVLLQEARALLKDNRLDEAEALCHRAAAIPARRGLFDSLIQDTPDRVLGEINSARSRRDREESARLLVEARKLFDQRMYAEAKVAAYRAAKLHGPYSVWEMGDRPSRIISEIEKLEAKQGKPFTSEPRMAQNNQGSKHSAAPSIAQVASKQQAKALVAEARELERKGRLIEARRKAIEAAQFGNVFAADEDTPQNVLAGLAAQCDRQVQLLLQRIEATAAGTDPGRFNKAEGDLTAARQLAHAFGQDAGRIEHKARWLRDLQLSLGMTPPPAPLAAGPPAEGKPQIGMDKLHRARLELKAGNTHIARPLAEELASDPGFGVQAEAFALIRSIDVEERNQALLTADRTAQAVIEAYKARNYKMARNILANLDLRLVNAQTQAALREIGSTQEMQPTAAHGDSHRLKPEVIQTQDTQPNISEPGRAQATDFGPLTARTTDPFDQLKAMEEIQFQQLRSRGLQAQNVSTDHATRGDLQRGMDVLTDYLNHLSATQLDPERMALLRRPVEMRLQNLKTLKAQEDLRKEEQQLANRGHNEGRRNQAIAKNQEQVVELMKQYRMFHKQGQLKEARAIVLQVKELDPDNTAATVALQILATQMYQNEHDRQKAINEDIFIRALDNDRGPYVNISNPLHVDGDRMSQAKKRSDSSRIPSIFQNPRERQIEQQLSLPVTISLKDMPLGTAIEYLRVHTGVPIMADEGALKEANISLDQPVSLPVEGISLKSALNHLLRRVHLTYVIRDEALLITTEGEAKGRYKTMTYSVADLVIPVDNKPTPSVFSFQAALERHIASQAGGYQTSINPGPMSLHGGQPVSMGTGMPYTPGGPGAGTAMAPGKRLAGQTIEDLLIDLVKNTIAPTTWRDVGGQGTIQYFPLGMGLIVSQTQEVQEEVFALLQSLRRLLDLEVAIELKLVAVSEAFFERLGLDFDITFLTNNKRYETQLLSGQFQPAGFINQFRPGRFVSGLTPAGTFQPDLNIPIRNSSFDFITPPFGGYPGTLGADGGLSLGLAFLSDVQVFMLLEAAQGDRRTAVMQAPKITVFNGQTATITVTDSAFFLLGVTANVTGFGNLFFSPTQTPLPLGVTMTVTPVVSADRRFVRLNMSPTLTNLSSTNVPLIPVQIPIPTFVFGPGVGGTAGPPEHIFQMFFQQPTVTTIAVDTTVNVPDGGTVLMGGLKTLSEARNEFGPPILSKIPYINRLFRNIGYGREAQSLMIMVTPRIIIQEEEMNIYEGREAPIPRF